MFAAAMGFTSLWSKWHLPKVCLSTPPLYHSNVQGGEGGGREGGERGRRRSGRRWGEGALSLSLPLPLPTLSPSPYNFAHTRALCLWCLVYLVFHQRYLRSLCLWCMLLRSLCLWCMLLRSLCLWCMLCGVSGVEAQGLGFS